MLINPRVDNCQKCGSFKLLKYQKRMSRGDLDICKSCYEDALEELDGDRY